jgi:hypothetical protein
MGSGAFAGPSQAVRDAFGSGQSLMGVPAPPSGQTVFTDASTVGSRYASYAPLDPNPRWNSAVLGPRVSTAPAPMSSWAQANQNAFGVGGRRSRRGRKKTYRRAGMSTKRTRKTSFLRKL